MPRPKKPLPLVKKKVSLSMELAARIDDRLTNPSTGKPEYGKFSELCSNLLERWLIDESIAPMPTYEERPQA